MIRSKENPAVTSLADENGQAAPSRGEKENLIPTMLFAGLISTTSKTRKSVRALAKTGILLDAIFCDTFFFIIQDIVRLVNSS